MTPHRHHPEPTQHPEHTEHVSQRVPRETAHKLARISLFGFIGTFILARVFVFLIMSKAMPNMYFFMGKTHVHHLNYGIFLLVAVGGYSVFRRPAGKKAELTALLYGVALGLTFDEFGMWLNLGGSYWQRVSVDAVVVVSAVLALIGFMSSIRRFEHQHFRMFVVLAALFLGFGAVIYCAGLKIGTMAGDTLHQLEINSSP